MLSNQQEHFAHLPVEDIKLPLNGNPRKSRNPQKFADLVSSIKANGIHTPLQVRQKDDDSYELVAGFGRLEAASEAKLSTVPCMVRKLSDAQAYQLSISENVDRESMSTLDEAHSLRQLITFYNGDIHAAADQMGWSKRKFKQALQLLRTSKEVQDHIGVKQDNGFVLSVAHASKLSQIPEETQNLILPSIIQNKLTVKQLTSKLEKAVERPLENAVFCKQECANCDFNTETQTSLFETDLQGSKCTKPTCFNNKTQKHYQDLAKELHKEYGKVILFSTVEGGIVDVSEAVVGDFQFKNGCLSCANFGAVLCDKGLNQGNVLNNQCLKKSCAESHRQTFLKASLKSATAKPTKNESVKSESVVDVEVEVDAEQAVEASETQATVTKSLISLSQQTIRSVGATLLLNEHPSYQLALSIAALRCLSDKNKKVESEVNQLIQLDPTKLMKTMSAEVAGITTLMGDHGHGSNIQKMVIEHANSFDSFQEKAIKEWQPTTSNLRLMRKSIRQQVLEQSKFAEAYKSATSEKEYTKLLNLKTDDQIEKILTFDFDWSNYAPDYYIDLISNYQNV